MRWGSSGTITAVVLVFVVATGDGVGAVARAAEWARAAQGGIGAPSASDAGGWSLTAAAQARSDSCNPNTDTMSPRVAARHLMAGRYKLGHHPLVRLGLRPTWGEDPSATATGANGSTCSGS